MVESVVYFVEEDVVGEGVFEVEDEGVAVVDDGAVFADGADVLVEQEGGDVAGEGDFALLEDEGQVGGCGVGLGGQRVVLDLELLVLEAVLLLDLLDHFGSRDLALGSAGEGDAVASLGGDEEGLVVFGVG